MRDCDPLELAGICRRPPRTTRADAVDPEPLFQSALCALWGGAPLPVTVPARTPPTPDDPAKAEAAWRGPLADDLLPVVQQWARLREVRRQEQRAKKDARREQLERQRDVQIRRSLLTGPGRVP